MTPDIAIPNLELRSSIDNEPHTATRYLRPVTKDDVPYSPLYVDFYSGQYVSVGIRESFTYVIAHPGTDLADSAETIFKKLGGGQKNKELGVDEMTDTRVWGPSGALKRALYESISLYNLRLLEYLAAEERHFDIYKGLEMYQQQRVHYMRLRWHTSKRSYHSQLDIPVTPWETALIAAYDRCETIIGANAR